MNRTQPKFACSRCEFECFSDTTAEAHVFATHHALRYGNPFDVDQILAEEQIRDQEDEAIGTALHRATRLADAVELHLLTTGVERGEGHPLCEAVRSYREARNRLQDVRDAIGNELAAAHPHPNANE